MHTAYSNPDPAKTDQLDGLRFFAFAAVFFFHFQPSPEYSSVLMFQKQGWVGVEVFFALSAFLLFRLFEQEQRRNGRISFSRFYARRLLRIYPLMILFPIAMLLAYGAQGAEAYGWLLSLASFVSNYLYWFPEKARSITNTGHLWTLSYEFQIYLVLPMLFLTYRAIGTRAFMLALLCVLPVCFLGRASFALSGMSVQWVYVTPMLRPESTVAGLLVALGLGRNLPIPVVSIAFLASCAGLVLLPDMHTQLGSVFVYLTAAIFTGSLLHLALYAKAFAQLLRWRPLAYLGRISFGLYVFHLWAFVEGMSLLRMTPIPENYATRCLAGMSLCIVAATVSYYLLERPILRLKPRAQSAKITVGSPPISASIARAVGSVE